MLTADVTARLEAQIPVLSGRVKQVADLADMLRTRTLPQSPVAAFILPIGLRPTSEADASTGAFTQMIADTVGVLLYVRAAGDAGGGKALPTISELIEDTINAVCGWLPDSGEAVMRLIRGALVPSEPGYVLYQIDFATPRQIRILS